MSWLVWVWVSVTVLLMCEATFYETIQQHLAPPGTNIQILGESFLLSSSCFIVHSDFSSFNLCVQEKFRNAFIRVGCTIKD